MIQNLQVRVADSGEEIVAEKSGNNSGRKYRLMSIEDAYETTSQSVKNSILSKLEKERSGKV